MWLEYVRRGASSEAKPRRLMGLTQPSYNRRHTWSAVSGEAEEEVRYMVNK